MSKVKEDTAKVDNTAVVKPKVFERLRVTPRKYELVDLGGTPSNDTRTPAERNKDYLHPIKGAKERFKASMSNETNPLVAQYIFGENPIIKRVFFNKATSNIKPISNNEAKRGFSHGDRYEQLYPGIYNRRYEMRSVVPQGRPLKFSSSEFAEYAGNNPVGKVIGKEGDMIMRTGDTEFMVFRNPGTNYVGPIDDVGGHVIKLQMDKGKLKQTSQDMWKFNPADYAKRWNESPNAPDQVRLTKQAALMDKVGTPFILQQSNPIWIEGRSVRQAMKVGGKFTFKKSPAVKDAEKLNGKRDMRKKFVKSSRPTYKRRIRKGQVGMRFVSYVPVNNPTIDYTDITNPINPFSEYYIPTTYNTEQALVVPEREDSKSDTVEEIPVIASKPIAELVVNKPVASKVVVDTANSTWSSPYKDKSKWAADLTNAYKRAGITNDNAIRMLVSQDALESAWGRSAQGKFNFGNLTTGAKWKGDYVTGNDKNAKGEAIKQKFRSYNSMDEYAADKVQFLKRLYDFDENDDINKFVAKLTGSNKGKRRYAEARNYADTLKKVYNSYRSGGIIKYQNPAQPIKYMGGYDKRGNMVLPVTNENGMNNVTLPEVTVTPRNINLAGAVDKGRREAAPYISTLLAGTMFGPLPVLSEAIGSTTVDEATRELSKGKYNTWGDMMTNAGMNPVLAEFTNPGSYIGLHGFNKFGPRLKPVEDLAASGNKWARARVISKTIDKGTPSVEPLPNNVGWGPRQSIHVVHDTDAPTKLTLYNPERWDTVYEGAPEAGIWYQGKFGNPRTAANHSIPGKAEKAAKARERFAKRPYRVEGDLELERPIVTVGDVPNRAALERAADKMNADGVIFNNVYDNGYSNNQVIFSFRDNLKNGRLFKKGSRQLTTPANHSLLLDMSGVAPRPLSEFSALSNEELAKLLPDYAHPNWQGDGFKLVKYRLWNGGFDRLEKYGDIPRYSPNLRTDILNSTPKIETSATLGEQPGIGLYRQSYSVNKDVMDKLTDAQAQDVGAHELVHYMYRPSKEQEAELAYNVRQYFKRPEGRDYFRQSRATEQTARGTQIKNYYGLNEGNQDITPAMWEYARRNYVKDTGINNNMTEWLNSVDERDIIAFTKWLSKHSPAIAAPLIGGTLYDDK